MSGKSVGSRSAASRLAASPLVCTWKAGSYGAAWVHVAGELDHTASPGLRDTLAEARLEATLVVVDLRELTFIDCVGMQVILDADADARREGARVVVVRGPAEVDRLFTLAEACDQVAIIDLAASRA